MTNNILINKDQKVIHFPNDCAHKSSIKFKTELNNQTQNNLLKQMNNTVKKKEDERIEDIN